MALTATASQGFEFVRRTGEEEILWLPGDPGDTFTRGDSVSMVNGVLDRVTDSVYAIGTVAASRVCPAATTVIPSPANFDPVHGTGGHLHLVPVRVRVAAGAPIYRVTFANQFDDTVASYSGLDITLTTSPGANDDGNGGLVYVYEGPGAGQVLVSADYVHGTKVLTLHATPTTALTSASKVIFLEGEGSGVAGVSFLGRIDAGDHNNLDCADGTDNGDWVVFMDYKQAAAELSQLKLLVVPSSAIFES